MTTDADLFFNISGQIIAVRKFDLFPVHVGCPLSPVLYGQDFLAQPGARGIWFGDHRGCCSVGFIEPKPPAGIGAVCEAAGIRVSTTKSEALVLHQERSLSSLGGWRAPGGGVYVSGSWP